MRFTPKNRAQRAAAAGVIALAVLGVSSCSAVNEQATVREYSPSDGIVENVGNAELRNLLVVSNGGGEAGRLIGTVINTSPENMDFTLNLGGSNLSWSIAAGEKVIFENAPVAEVTVANVDVLPGTGLSADAGTGSETATLDVPVVDGTLQDYRQYLPTPQATPTDSASVPAEPAAGSETEQPVTP